MKELLLGALKSFLGGASGVITILNIVDPEKFSVATLGGWKHLGLVLLVAGITSEARFIQQWANAVNPSGANPPTPAPKETPTVKGRPTL